MQNSPSLTKIFSNDFIAFISAIIPLVFLVIFIGLPLFNKEPITTTSLLIGGVTAALGVIIFFWRYRRISSLFEDGSQVEGTITQISFFRDRGNVTYIYDFENNRYEGGGAIMKTKATSALHPGQKVSLVLDRDNPKRAIIRDLYI